MCDTPYFWFLFLAIKEALLTTSNKLGFETTATSKDLAVVAGVVLSVINTLCDLTIANPIETAEAFLDSSKDDVIDTEIKTHSPVFQKSVKTFIYFNQFVANLTYVVGGAANALAFAYWSTSLGVQLGLGIPVTLFGIVFYNLIQVHRIKEHSYEFMNRLFSSRSMLVEALKSFNKSFEVIIQSTSVLIYRSVMFAYIMKQILIQVFGCTETDPSNTPYLLTIAVLTAYVSLYSRVLNVYREYFNNKINTYPDTDWKKINVPSQTLILDAFLSLLRGSAAALLFYKNADINAYASTPISLFIGFIGIAHSFRVRYQKQQQKFFLEQMSSEQLLRPGDNDTPDKLFDCLSRSFQTASLERKVTIVNSLGRVARSLAFLGFLVSLNDFEKFDFVDVLCFHQLWGNTTFQNEASFYQESLLENWTYYRTKINLEGRRPLYGFSAFFMAKKQYPSEYLREFPSEVPGASR